MGASEQYCLKWNGFESNITSSFSEIRDDEDFLDVTLVTGGQTIRAHKLVLSACSPLFRSMLKKNTHPQPMIFIHGVRYADITAILNFMYHGEVNVSQEDLPTFLAAAEELRIRGLSDKNNLEGDTEPGEESSPRKRPRKQQDLDSSTSQEEPTSHSPRAKKANTSSSGGGGDGIGLSNNQPSTSNVGLADESTMSEEDTNKDLIVTPDIAPEFHDDSNSVSEQGFSEFGFPYEPGTLNNSSINYSRRSGRLDDSLEVGHRLSSSFGGKIGKIEEGTIRYQVLGGRDDRDPLTHLEVARSSLGWHCPQCPHVTTTKGNLKSHILSGKHKLMNKNFRCQFCLKYYSTRQSLQVHISTNHRQERDEMYKNSLETHRRNRKFIEGMESDELVIPSEPIDVIQLEEESIDQNDPNGAAPSIVLDNCASSIKIETFEEIPAAPSNI